MFTRTCALDSCNNVFQTDISRKTHCSRQHANLARMRRLRAKRRKGGGGPGGSGGAPTLFDEIIPQDSQAIYAPDTCYRTPEVPAKRPASIRPHGLRRAA
jgi:hypothetical protein